MRRVRVDDVHKMQKFSTTELKQSIRNAIKPELSLMSNVDKMLLTILS